MNVNPDYQFEPTFQQRLDRVNIDEVELLEILEAAWWALEHRRDEVGDHLDLNDEYLTGLVRKLYELQNDGDYWEELTRFSCEYNTPGDER